MPLMLIYEHGLTRPAFVCDLCGKEITDAFDGNYEWNQSETWDASGTERTSDIKYLHKKCSRPYSLRFGDLDCNMGIHNLLVYLTNNTGLIGKRLAEARVNTAYLSEL